MSAPGALLGLAGLGLALVFGAAIAAEAIDVPPTSDVAPTVGNGTGTPSSAIGAATAPVTRDLVADLEPPVCAAELPAPTMSAACRLARLLDELDAGHDEVGMVAKVRDLLLVHPELAATLSGHVLSPLRSERGAARLLQALGCSGDSGCQMALAAVAADAAAPSCMRELAMRSLGDVLAPTAAAMAALWSHVGIDAGAAALAFGQATARLAATDPDLHQRCCAQLQAALRRATEPEQVGRLLKSLASSGYARLEDEAIYCFSATDPCVRAIAAYVLLGCEGTRIEAIANDLLRTESAAEVRATFRRGLDRRRRV